MAEQIGYLAVGGIGEGKKAMCVSERKKGK